MQTVTLLYIVLAGILALVLALFQYGFNRKKTKQNWFFTLLRFITYFAVFLLLINPKFEQVTVYDEKPKLAVAIDNSSSIRHLDQESNVQQLYNNIQNSQELNNRFDVQYFLLGDGLRSFDSLSFSDANSNIVNTFKEFEQIFSEQTAPALLITDGNQTQGSDFEYASRNFNQAVFPVILGDTTKYVDLKIDQLNVNKYAYLKNKFPVEVFVSYSGNEPVNSTLKVTIGSSTIQRIPFSISPSEKVKVFNITLPANNVGVQRYSVTVDPLSNEKNRVNNQKPFAVEVIDQKSSIAIVTNMLHPDLGSLKKAIESSEQREVTFVSPTEFIRDKGNYQLAILYQPDASFRAVFEQLDKTNDNRFIITGTKTQWSFLNTIQKQYQQEITTQTEDYQALLNSSYNTFIVNDFDVSSFPPLVGAFGKLTTNIPVDAIFYKSVRGISDQEPLLLTFENESRREALLLGEGLWRWRAQQYLNTESFQEFDDFVNKLIQYLASTKRSSRLNVSYESFYDTNDQLIISAQYFNKNYEFDNQAQLELLLKNTTSNQNQTIPFVIRQNNYQVDLSGIEAGDYEFIVIANDGELRSSGRFSVLEFNVEQQFLNANYTKLEKVAQETEGKAYFINNYDTLFNDLLADNRFKTIEKSTKNIVPLIDLKWLLVLIALSLATEWFSRKYNGLI